MIPLPDVTGLGWSKIRSLAQEAAAAAPVEEVATAAAALLDSPEPARRQFAVYLLGLTCGRRSANLTPLHDRVAGDPSWQVQEALAQAFDAGCATVGYDAALPLIDAWLADPHPNVRRAVTEGLRPWTARHRAPFARQPEEAVRRLAALRADPSEYVRHSVGNALRDVRRAHPALVDADTAAWNLADPQEAFTYRRVLAPR